jgi:hypothetical protein
MLHEGGETAGQTDGHKHMKKLIVDFRNFTNAPKNESRFIKACRQTLLLNRATKTQK